MMIRIQSWSSLLLCMRGSFHLWENYFKTRPAARTRVNGEVTANGFYPLFYYGGAVAVVVELRQREASNELETFTIVVDGELPGALFGTQPDDDVFCAAVAGDVYERFADNVPHLARNFYRQHQFANVRNEAHTNAGILAVLIDAGDHPLDEAVGIEVHRLELLNELPQVRDLALHQLLNVEEFAGNILRETWRTDAQGIKTKCDGV